MGEIFAKIKTSPSIKDLMKRIEGGSRITVSFVNPYSYCLLRNKKILNEFDYIFCDGILLSFLASLFAFKKIPRVSFDMTSLAPLLFNFLSEQNLSVFIVGSTPEAIKYFCKNIQKTYPYLRIAGFNDGFFQEIREKEIIGKIKDAQADVVICGMGSVKQEIFIMKLMKEDVKLKACFTCGGFIHQGSKKLQYYPKIIDALQLRWFYRLLYEPHTRKRFFKYYPLFLVYFIIDNLIPLHR